MFMMDERVRIRTLPVCALRRENLEDVNTATAVGCLEDGLWRDADFLAYPVV